MTEQQTVAEQERERWLDKLCLEINWHLDLEPPLAPADIDLVSVRKHPVWTFDHDLIAKHIAWEVVRVQPDDRLRFILNVLHSAITRGFGKSTPSNPAKRRT